MVEGKNEEMSTSELSGGARIHYIFQSIFVKSLEVSILEITCILCTKVFYFVSFKHELNVSYWIFFLGRNF